MDLFGFRYLKNLNWIDNKMDAKKIYNYDPVLSPIRFTYLGAMLNIYSICGIKMWQTGNNEYLQKEKLPTNCKNCGAALTSNVCEYCGTHY